MTEQKRYLNLVFQGGGIRGIAYAGALEIMPDHCQIHSVGGTSAGAIVAALLATGVKIKKLKDILSDQRLFNLLKDCEVERTNRLKDVLSELLPLLEQNRFSSFAKVLWILFRKKIIKDLREVWINQGLHTSGPIRGWLNEVLEGKKFSQIDVEDLRIVAADVTKGDYIIFDKNEHRGIEIAEAVQASISIPLFFRPFLKGPDYYVDGGILSNFPSFLFAEEPFPTIGFRLGDIELPNQINSTIDYLKALLITMAEAHDKERENPPNFKTYQIRTSRHISSTKFADLTTEDSEELYQAGRSIGRSVEWNEYSSTAPLISYFDPKPHETLEFSLSQARKLWEKYADKDLWVDTLDHEVTFEARIEWDWSMRYDLIATMKVDGEKSFFISRFLVMDWDKKSHPSSFVDLRIVYREITSGGSKDVIKIPAFSQENKKGFVIFFVPPISKNQESRRFQSRFQVLKEFASTVAKGQTDSIGYQIGQRAKTHRLKLQFNILVDVDLPKVVCSAREFGKTINEGDPIFDRSTKRTYKTYKCNVGSIQVTGKHDFDIEIGLA